MKISESKLRKIISEEIKKSIRIMNENYDQKLTPKQEMEAWDGGYELASLHKSQGKIYDPGTVFLVANRMIADTMGIPNESHPLFYPIVMEAEAGYKAFMESYPEDSM